MEFLNKKQKIILTIIGSMVVIFIGYYIMQKTIGYKEYEELEIIEENNSESRECYSRRKNIRWGNYNSYNRRGVK